MGAYLKRLLTAGVAYQAGDILSKGVALFTLPLYTSYVSPSGYGYAETLMTAVILLSIVLRLGVGEAFIRFYFDDEDGERRDRIARAAVACTFATTTTAALVGVALAGPLSRALLGAHHVALLELAMLGLWAFTNLEIAYALLRADERTGTYMRASVVDVVVTIGLTAFLVVGRRAGAEGLLAGNYSASCLVLVGLWWTERRRLVGSLRGARAALHKMFAFGLPTVPADASVYALQVADRWYLLRAQSAAAAGLYALAAKLATVVFVAVRGFQYAWPPLAYSIEDDAVAARLYAIVTTYYVLGTGAVVAGVALLGRWAVRLLLHHGYFGAHLALPWLALGWALYGLYLIFIVISGRARRTRLNLPAALAGLVVNVVSLFLLVPPLGLAGAGVALALAYVTMIIVIHLLTRRIFTVEFEWGRLARLVAVLVAISVAGELALPTAGAEGFILRGAAWCLIWPALRAAGFFRRDELAGALGLLRRALRRPA
jgi:O-antigen/teichoic acid export membrane protein